MKLDELKTIWKRQKPDKGIEYSKEEHLMMINNQVISFEEQVRSRDRIEIMACFFVALSFGVWFFTASSIWTEIGCVILVLASIFIGIRLKMARPKRTSENICVDKSITKHLEEEMTKVKKQKKLLTNIAWWYLLPIYVGQVFIALGFTMALPFKIGFLVVVTILTFYIWYVNQRTVKARFDPLLNDLNASIAFLEMKEKQ